MSKITVIDAMMGRGKTQHAINRAIRDSFVKDKFVYITPYLDEVDRLKEICENNGVKVWIPTTKNLKGSKLESIKQALQNNVSVIATHELFSRLDKECLEYLNNHNYTLYLDEVHEVVKVYEDMSSCDFKLLLNDKVIKIDEITGRVNWVKEDLYIGRFNDFKILCELGVIYSLGNSIIIWTFPIEIFNSFNEIFIMTYLFEAQLQASYYKMYNIKYKYSSIFGANGKYVLTSFNKTQYIEDIKHYRKLINLYIGKLNYEEEDKISLTSYWFKNKCTIDNLLELGNRLYNYVRNIVKSSDKVVMWTSLEEFRKEFHCKRYERKFIPLNTRATNKYIKKKCLVYLYNRHINPIISNYFLKRGVIINENAYALSELLQWIFRSAIRNGEQIDLYLPSSRMRSILNNWRSYAEKLVEQIEEINKNYSKD